MEKQPLGRRQFLKAAAGFTIVPNFVMAAANETAPSEKLNIACIGAGGMGAVNLEAVASENIVALCDVDFDRAAESFNKFPNAARYKDFRRMLDREKAIEAVIIATPRPYTCCCGLIRDEPGQTRICPKTPHP